MRCGVMSKEEDLEKLDIEYSLFEVDKIDSIDEVNGLYEVISDDIDEYDERLLRHLALGYTKEMITGLRGMPFGVKSIEKRQNDLVTRLFNGSERSVNATRLVTRAIELRILDVDNLQPDDE